MKHKTFLICPVRNYPQQEIEKRVKEMEDVGWKVYYPTRDTNQDDPTGLQICKENKKAISKADFVTVIWDGKSQGCLFDLGMAFAMNKPIFILSIPKATEGKSFQNMMRAWAYNKNET